MSDTLCDKPFQGNKLSKDGRDLVNSSIISPDTDSPWFVIWKDRWIILLLTGVFSVAALVYIVRQPNVYQAEAILAPVSRGNAGALGGISSQLAGLTGLAGLNFSGGQVDETQIALEVLRSRSFINKFIETHQLAVPLVAAHGWDSQNSQWVIDKTRYADGRWVGAYSEKSPTSIAFEAYHKFISNLTVFQDAKSGFVRVGVKSESPVSAHEWTNLLVEDINSFIKNSAILESERNVEYLQNQIEATNISEMQQVFYSLIEREMKNMMLAKVRDEYALRFIDRAMMPEVKSGPNRKKFVILIFMVSLLVSVVLSLVKENYWYKGGVR